MKYNDLVQAIRNPIFSRDDILLAGHRIHDYQLNLWVKKGYLVKLKNGIYAFTKDCHKVKGEEVASLLYQPSYLSLESALSYYGFIPEMVYAYVSVTAKINRTFNNRFGHFIYRHIKSDFFWGYTDIRTENGRYLLAEPEKAVLDYLYLNMADINTPQDFDNIRLNEQKMRESLNREKFLIYLRALGSKKLERWALRCLP
ncbi:MAG: hypothetical protein FJ139_11250 [Deltaproteobacteria bacterium]|nr:hypothetical protein [Deltaproteobacteria bacterium]